jgi:hypothetical protein
MQGDETLPECKSIILGRIEEEYQNATLVCGSGPRLELLHSVFQDDR